MTAKEWLTNFMEGHRQEKILCIHGPQGSGKSSLARMIALACELSEVHCDNGRTLDGRFQGQQFEGKTLAIYEEINDLHISRLKDWAKSRRIGVMRMAREPYVIENTTSFVVVRDTPIDDVVNCGVAEGLAIIVNILEQQARKD